MPVRVKRAAPISSVTYMKVGQPHQFTAEITKFTYQVSLIAAYMDGN